jgi:hypothetical protein
MAMKISPEDMDPAARNTKIPTCSITRTLPRPVSTMPRITSLEPKLAPRTGAVKVAPRPSLAGTGVKRTKP